MIVPNPEIQKAKNLIIGKSIVFSVRYIFCNLVVQSVHLKYWYLISNIRNSELTGTTPTYVVKKKAPLMMSLFP